MLLMYLHIILLFSMLQIYKQIKTFVWVFINIVFMPNGLQKYSRCSHNIQMLIPLK